MAGVEVRQVDLVALPAGAGVEAPGLAGLTAPAPLPRPVVYTLATAVAMRRLLLDPSDKAADARRVLGSMGFLRYVQNLVPLLGAVERATVSLLHIGFTRWWAGVHGWSWSPCRCTARST